MFRDQNLSAISEKQTNQVYPRVTRCELATFFLRANPYAVHAISHTKLTYQVPFLTALAGLGEGKYDFYTSLLQRELHTI